MDALTVSVETKKTIDDFLASHTDCSFLEKTRGAPYDRPHILDEWQLNIVSADNHSVELLYHCESEDHPQGEGVLDEYCRPRDAIQSAYPQLPSKSENRHFKSPLLH